MINRSKIKYSLKKFLPKMIFDLILELWQKILVRIIDVVDNVRLKNFKTYRAKKIAHRGQEFSLYISPKNGFIDKHIYLYGAYEPQILDLIARYLKKGGVFIDIGANIGQHSMFAASIVGVRGKVYSFEPIPYIFNQILDSARINHFDSIISAHNVALGEKNRTATLYVDKSNIGGSSVVKADRKDSSEITIDIKRGDDVLNNIQHINMIKMDVEGYEHEALLGMQKTITLYKPIIILEFSGQMYSFKGNNDGDKILSFLEKIGYDIYDVGNYMKKIISKDAFLSEFTLGRNQCDILCLPRNKNYEI